MKLLNFLLITILIAAIISCKKKNKPTTHTDIYFAGSTNISTDTSRLHRYFSAATYWKNGVPTILSTDSSRESDADGILVNGNDVYVVGSIRIPISSSYVTHRAAYWKNGVLTKLGMGVIEGIAMVGKDVYMVGTCFGFGGNKLAVWKNGVLDTLGNGKIQSIAVDGDDIYMAGFRTVSDKFNDVNHNWNVATYWKNGKYTMLDNTQFLSTSANNVFIHDGDKYFSGSRGEKAEVPMYWKNRDTVTLSSKKRKLYGSAIGIFVDENSDVYVSGYTYIPTHDGLATFGAIYWKNATPNFLPYKGERSFARCIVVDNNTVYVGGNDDYPVYWKNGKRIQLGNAGGAVSTVTIVSY